MTLEQLANATGLSRGFISRIENDATSPSINTLVQICQVLSLPIGNLFSEPETQLVHLDTAPHINMGGTGVVERLLTPRAESRAQLIHTTADPNANGGQELYTVSSDLEVLHVARGSVRVEFSSHSVELVQGDTISFPGREPHNWHAHEEGAELLWTLIPAAWSGSA
jgi:transcriptional regulator with XRE-family HTH domain